MADIATAATEASPFVAELESKNLHPLWDRYQRITPIKPQPQDAPFLWRWREVEPLLQRSVGEVSINDIERRALIMAHPAFGAETTTTSTLLAAFTVLDPGERARPHRHTGAAIRFATRAARAAEATAFFFGAGDAGNTEFWRAAEGEEVLGTEAGLGAEGAPERAANEHRSRCPAEGTLRFLDAAPAGADGMRVIRYVNPV